MNLQLISFQLSRFLIERFNNSLDWMSSQVPCTRQNDANWWIMRALFWQRNRILSVSITMLFSVRLSRTLDPCNGLLKLFAHANLLTKRWSTLFGTSLLLHGNYKFLFKYPQNSLKIPPKKKKRSLPIVGFSVDVSIVSKPRFSMLLSMLN